MEIKNVKKQLVLGYSLKTTLKEITTVTCAPATQIVLLAKELSLQSSNIQIWQYTGCDGNPDTVFTLEICIPVDRMIDYDKDGFKVYELPEMHCVSEIHKGAWNNLMQTYSKIMEYMCKNKLNYTDKNREIYKLCDWENPDNCITEVQGEYK